MVQIYVFNLHGNRLWKTRACQTLRRRSSLRYRSKVVFSPRKNNKGMSQTMWGKPIIRHNKRHALHKDFCQGQTLLNIKCVVNWAGQLQTNEKVV